MKYVCDHSGACERKPCYHEGKHTHLSACDPPRSELKGCDHLHSKCIPVEPERVIPSCTYPGSCVYPATSCKGCGWFRVPKPDHTYAQRAGMLEREMGGDPLDGWIVVERHSKGFRMMTDIRMVYKPGVAMWHTVPGHEFRAFRWQDGVQG